MKSGIHLELTQNYLGSPVNRKRSLSMSHDKSEGNMLTSHHSQGDIPKINAFMFTRFFELPRKKMCCVSGPINNFFGFHLKLCSLLHLFIHSFIYFKFMYESKC